MKFKLNKSNQNDSYDVVARGVAIKTIYEVARTGRSLLEASVLTYWVSGVDHSCLSVSLTLDRGFHRSRSRSEKHTMSCIHWAVYVRYKYVPGAWILTIWIGHSVVDHPPCSNTENQGFHWNVTSFQKRDLEFENFYQSKPLYIWCTYSTREYCKHTKYKLVWISRTCQTRGTILGEKLCFWGWRVVP